jgi:hypothetical protein
VAGGLQKPQGAPGLGRHAALVEGQGEVEEVGFLALAKVEEHGGFVRAGHGSDAYAHLAISGSGNFIDAH